jgi:hypothetical protein
LPLPREPSQATQLAVAQKAVRDEDIDGEALLTLGETDIQDVLQVGTLPVHSFTDCSLMFYWFTRTHSPHRLILSI